MGTNTSRLMSFKLLTEKRENFKFDYESFDSDYYLTDDILTEILSHVSAEDLLRNCSLVCTRWRDLIAGHGIWKRKCLHDGKVIPPLNNITIPPNFFRQIYLQNPYGRNFIKNPSGENGLEGWDILQNGGDGWEVECPPEGADCVPVEVGTQFCFSSSYYECVKCQHIDLFDEGVHPEVLAKVRPKIEIGEWHAARFDCGSLYELNILLSDVNEIIVDSFTFGPYEEAQWTGRAWSKVTHTFCNYPRNLRYILFRHRGRDTQFWAGNYGSKTTGSYVKFTFS